MSGIIADLVARNALRAPDRPAIFYEGRILTYGDYARRVYRLANALAVLGVQRLDRVSFLSMNRPEMSEIYAANEVANFISSPINFRLTAAEMRFILGDADPRVLIFEDQYADLVDGLRPHLPGIQHFVCLGASTPWAQNYEDLLASASEARPAARPAPDDPCLLMYTSGTTGRPKGALRSQHAEAAYAQEISAAMETALDSRCLIMMPVFHVGGRGLQIATFWRRGAVVLHRRFEPRAALQAIQDLKVTEVHMAPTLLQMMLDEPDVETFDLSSVRTIMYSAAPMPVPLLRRGMAVFGRVFIDGYGQTEGAGTILLKQQHLLEGSPDEVRRIGSVGQAVGSGEIRVVDDEGRDCPPGEPGEILIRNETVMLGYWNNSAATIEALRDGWLRTGDIGALDDQGFLFLLDRKKDMIISGGENVYCREVEEAISTLAAVAEVAVIGVPDPRWGETVMAVIRLEPGASLTEADLVAHCRELIAGYKCPRKVAFVEDLPRIPTGKVNKVQLRLDFQPQGEAARA